MTTSTVSSRPRSERPSVRTWTPVPTARRTSGGPGSFSQRSAAQPQARNGVATPSFSDSAMPSEPPAADQRLKPGPVVCRLTSPALSSWIHGVERHGQQLAGRFVVLPNLAGQRAERTAPDTVQCALRRDDRVAPSLQRGHPVEPSKLDLSWEDPLDLSSRHGSDQLVLAVREVLEQLAAARTRDRSDVIKSRAVDAADKEQVGHGIDDPRPHGLATRGERGPAPWPPRTRSVGAQPGAADRGWSHAGAGSQSRCEP